MSFLNDKITFGYIQDYTDPSNEPLGMSGNVVKFMYISKMKLIRI